MKSKKISLIIVTCFINVVAIGQKNIEFAKQVLRNDKIQFATLKNIIQPTETEKKNLLKSATDNSNSISSIKIETKKTGKEIVHDKFQLLKNGIKLRGGEYVITYNNLKILSIHGFYADAISESVVNKNNKKQFIKNAINYFNEKVVLDDKIINSSNLIYYFNYKTEKYQLAYEVYLESKINFRAENIYLSAIDGSLLGTESKVCSINFPGTANTQYNGARNIVTDAPTAAGPFRLFETRGPNNVIIHTRNNNLNGIEVVNATELVDNDNNWTFAEHGNLRAGFDAHWGAETVFDYWQTVHNRNSINDAGMPIQSFFNVNLGNPVNAGWLNGRMYYGNGLSGGNVTCLDVCAHEFGHGIDDFTGALLYERESGALDEGFADIWGACVEAWATPLKNRWLIGEDLNVGAFRNMANPNMFGQPDTYLNTNNFWANTNCGAPNGGNDFCGVHTNSGVLNYWFFLITEGDNGTNANGNVYNVNGLGIATSQRIAYLTKLAMNNSLANYPLCREISIQVTRQEYGIGSCEEIAVTRAWFAVGVGADYNGTLPNISGYIDGNDLFCDNGTYSFFGAVPAGATVTWSSSDNAIATVIGSGINATVTRVSNGNFDLIMRINLPTNTCFSQTSYEFIKSVIVGNPSTLPIMITPNGTSLCTGTPFTAETGLQGATSYNWTAPTGLAFTSPNGLFEINAQVTSIPLGGQLTVNATNNCGIVFGYNDVVPTPQFPYPGKFQPYITLLSNSCFYNIFQGQVTPVAGANLYTWQVREYADELGVGAVLYTSPLITSTTNISPFYALNSAATQSARAYVYATTPCGNSNTVSQLFKHCKTTPRLSNPIQYIKEEIVAIPNPTNGISRIELPIDMQQIANFEIASSNGKILKKGKIVNQKGIMEVNLTPYPSGIYFITINNAKRNIKVKLIKN